MNSLDGECTPLKQKYDECFNVWFRDGFLKGKAGQGHDQACGELFKSYQSCLEVTYTTRNNYCECPSCLLLILTLHTQKAFEKHKIPRKDVYNDVLGTDREKTPTPPKPKSRT